MFIFMLDTCIIEEELAALKESILQSLMLFPENAKVGLITFGKNVRFRFCMRKEKNCVRKNRRSVGGLINSTCGTHSRTHARSWKTKHRYISTSYLLRSAPSPLYSEATRSSPQSKSHTCSAFENHSIKRKSGRINFCCQCLSATCN